MNLSPIICTNSCEYLWSFRTVKCAGLPLSWRCRIKAHTCWRRTAKQRWRNGSARSTRSSTAALNRPCRRRGTEICTTVCACVHVQLYLHLCYLPLYRFQFFFFLLFVYVTSWFGFHVCACLAAFISASVFMCWAVSVCMSLFCARCGPPVGFSFTNSPWK